MLAALSVLVSKTLNASMRAFRLPGLDSAAIYSLLGIPRLQPAFRRLARHRSVSVFRAAARSCPAYREFLAKAGHPGRVTLGTFRDVPETTKENYVKAYSIEARCFGGRIPARGVVIDESSGSSGVPNNWVRSQAERASVRRMIQHGFAMTFRDDPVFFLNCFALGPWATGMNVSMSLADATILKSIGPDRAKLEATLRTFGPAYRYAIAGYPPFIKDFADNTTLDLKAYELHLIVGGEGISEPLRDRLLRSFRSVHSSYGASDLEINIGAETRFTIALRRACLDNAALRLALFGPGDLPMVFQHDPLDYLIETNAAGELVFTLLRPGYAAPRVRYNLRDLGGALSHARVMEVLRAHGVDPRSLPRSLAFPILFVRGRSDLTVPFYGCKISPADVEAVLSGDAVLAEAFHCFQIASGHDGALSEILTIALERARGGGHAVDAADLRRRLFTGLQRVNQDFREVSKMFAEDKLLVEVHEFETGPFAARDIRVKNRYLRT